MFQRYVSLRIVLLLLTACGSQHKNSDRDDAEAQKPAPAQPTSDAAGETYDAELAKDYAALPKTVLLGADVDAQGRELNAQMRVPADAAAAPASDDAALAAYASGQPVRTVRSADELDSSTPSWGSYEDHTDYNAYAPTAYSQSRKGKVFTYTKDSRRQKDGKVVYTYQRPACSPAYCAPTTGTPAQKPGPAPQPQYPQHGNDYDSYLTEALQKYGVYAVRDDEFRVGSREQIDLGGRLFYEKGLSGNGKIACASCHVEQYGTGSLFSVGAAQPILSNPNGRYGVDDLLARNVPPLYNLGHKSFGTMFWDSRVSQAPGQPKGYFTPAGDQLPDGLDSALAAQALFPLITGNEMGCGFHGGANAGMSTTPAQDWDRILQRVMSRGDYRAMFAAAYPQAQGQYSIAHLANAIAAFESWKWKAVNSPFDRYVRGDRGALNEKAKAGATYFYGKAQCAQCHAGPLQTDHGRHSIAIPQWGPGAGDGQGGREDYGFGRISGNPADRYKFRTPSLRNVAVTGPWGHDGAYTSLRDFVIHYTNPRARHDAWDAGQVIVPKGLVTGREMYGAWYDGAARGGIRDASEIDGIPLTDGEIDALVEFLRSLTDEGVAYNSNIVNVNRR